MSFDMIESEGTSCTRGIIEQQNHVIDSLRRRTGTLPNTLHHREPRNVLQGQPLPLPAVLVSIPVARLPLPNLGDRARIVAPAVE